MSQHLKVLRDAGLVVGSPRGRQVLYSAQPEALLPLVDWLDGYERFWKERMTSLRELLAELPDD